MIDFARITVKAGDGGRGAGSFTHIKGKRLGKADGGDGGRGGNVYFVASGDINTLETFRYVKDYKAQSGQMGGSQRRRGAGGADLVLKVPRGTQIKMSDEEVYDLVNEGDKVLVARGGEGGRGNSHLRDEYGRRPKSGEAGSEGEFREITLELKLIADVGLIGLPNAGKSTLLSALTSAKPAIADYPFTTLEPNLGVIELVGPDASSSQPTSSANTELSDGLTRSKSLRALAGTPSAGATHKSGKLVLADIPGLIEGASTGKGLGDLFLRHIERTKMLVHLIDASTNSDKWEDYQTIRKELKAYSKELAKKKEIIVLAKIDLIEEGRLDQIVAEFKAKRKKVIAISATEKKGLGELVKKLVSRV